MAERKRPVSIGGASLFAVLIILCLLVFAMLAKLTAQNELKLAEKAAEAMTAYYDAEMRANIRIANGETSFAEEIDEFRELKVSYSPEAGITEWAVVPKIAEDFQDNLYANMGEVPF